MASIEIRQRLNQVDVLRGVAVVGMVVWDFRSWTFGYFDPPGGYLDNLVCGGIASLNIQHTVYPIFAMLFGWGLGTQEFQSRTIDTPFVRSYIRRMGGLYVLGIANYLFVDKSDILHYFAIYGICALLFLHRSNRALCIVAACCIASAIIGPVVAQRFVPADVYRGGSGISLREEMIIAAGYAASVMAHCHDLVLEVAHPSSYIANMDILGAMSFGLYVARRRVIEDMPDSNSLIRISVWLCLIASIVGAAWIYALGETMAASQISNASDTLTFRVVTLGDRAWILDPLLREYASYALSISYAGAILLISQRPMARSLLRPIEYVGKMALSAYLLHGLIGTTLFYGYGLGLYGVGCAGREALAIAVCALLIWIAGWWHARFLYGPSEWAWRCFASWKVLPLRGSG